MAAYWSHEYSFEQFKEAKSKIEAAANTNEATTRFRAINVMLIDVLGWDETLIDSEHYCRTIGYADYALKDGTSICMILEAKKAGKHFLLPNRSFPDHPIGFSLLAQECKEAEEAMRQALGYAAEKGARYIGISNGHQWIMTLAFVLNQPLDQRSVFVFESIDAIQRKFRQFCTCFGPEGLYGNKPADAILESRKAPPPDKLSKRIDNYPRPADRNFIANEIAATTGSVLNEILHNEQEFQFLQECYVEPQASTSAIVQAQEIISQRLSIDEQAVLEVANPETFPELLQRNLHEKPVIILGKIGHGKTTFLRYLRIVKAPNLLQKYIQLDVDFIDRPDIPTNVGHFIYSQIKEQLANKYNFDLDADNIVRGILHFDLEKFPKTPEGKAFPPNSPDFKREELRFIRSITNDQHCFLQKAFHHLRAGRGNSVAIFFDNVDRRNVEIQEEAFLRASAIARDCASVVFICLRPATYFLSRQFGVLDSVAPIVIPITSPNTRSLITSRLEYARKIAIGCSSGSATSRTAFGRNISVHLPTTADFLECMIKSFQRSTKLVHLFEATSNGNARDLLSNVQQVLTSLHLDTRKILDKYRSSAIYLMPEHEALRALLYDNQMDYDPSRCVFLNLFDISRSDKAEHFTKLIALHYLHTIPENHPQLGLCEVSRLQQYLCQIGYSEQHVIEVIRCLFEAGCCEAKEPLEQWTEKIICLRITTRGRYLILDLIKKFVYFDAIVIDTPILDATYREQITDVTPIYDRIQRCKYFIEYLDKCSLNIHDIASQQFWHEISNCIYSDIKSIEDKLDHPYHK